MACQRCRADAPTKHVRFYQNIGMLVMRTTKKTDGELCRPCIGQVFKEYTLTTFFLGWWGYISLVMTPFILINNLYFYFSSLKLATTHVGALVADSGGIIQAPPPIE
jgi:hypothetical protein